jgi:hypothetical protein
MHSVQDKIREEKEKEKMIIQQNKKLNISIWVMSLYIYI